jgi:hypothetical protein
MKRIVAQCAIGAFMLSAIPVYAANENWKEKFAKVSDEYFDQVFFPYAPTYGTLVGYHQYDAQLEDYSRKNIDAEIAALKVFEKRIEAIYPDAVAADFVPRSDRKIVLANIRSQLLTLETIRPWEKNADNYSSTCANGAFTLIGSARTADAGAAGRCACEPEEPAAHFYRDCN